MFMPRPERFFFMRPYPNAVWSFAVRGHTRDASANPTRAMFQSEPTDRADAGEYLIAKTSKPSHKTFTLTVSQHDLIHVTLTVGLGNVSPDNIHFV